jgi:DNA-binding NarL/FixJ family response regulator
VNRIPNEVYAKLRCKRCIIPSVAAVSVFEPVEKSGAVPPQTARWHDLRSVCCLVDAERHLGNVVKAGDHWLAFDATHLNESHTGPCLLGSAPNIAVAKCAVELAIAKEYDSVSRLLQPNSAESRPADKLKVGHQDTVILSTMEIGKPILLCDTQPVAVAGVLDLLSRCDDLRFAGAVASLEEAFELTQEVKPAAVVIDQSFGTTPITNWLRRLAISGEGATGETPAPVIWGAGLNELEALRFLRAGARGVLRRTSALETLVTCLRCVTSGDTWLENGIFADSKRLPHALRSHLTPREVEIANLVEKGFPNSSIANNLRVSTRTVKVHLTHIFKKTGVRGRYGLALERFRGHEYR